MHRDLRAARDGLRVRVGDGRREREALRALARLERGADRDGRRAGRRGRRDALAPQRIAHDRLPRVVEVAERVALEALGAQEERVGEHRPVDARAVDRPAEEVRRRDAGVDRVAVDVRSPAGAHVDLELGLAERGDEHARPGDAEGARAVLLLEAEEVVADRRIGGKVERTRERAELVRVDVVLRELLTPGVAEDEQEAVLRWQRVPGVVVGADDALVGDRLAGRVDRTVGVEVSDVVARVSGRQSELVGRGPAEPARAHRAEAPAVERDPERAVAARGLARGQDRKRDRGEALRVGHDVAAGRQVNVLYGIGKHAGYQLMAPVRNPRTALPQDRIFKRRLMQRAKSGGRAGTREPFRPLGRTGAQAERSRRGAASWRC